MLILLPAILMSLTALALLILRLFRPKFKYPWILAAGGALLALLSVLLWQIHIPSNVALPSWQLKTGSAYTLAWIADGISWAYALALAALATAVIWTSVVHSEAEPVSWAGTLILTTLGILAIAAENPLTLLLAWSAIDLFELIILLRSTEGQDQIEGVIIAFVARVAGLGLVIWANLASAASGSTLDFRSTPGSAGIYLIIAAGLRLGVLPLHLPYTKDKVFRRGFGTALRLVPAAASLALLARIPAPALELPLRPFLLLLIAIPAVYGGWMWLRSSDEILGRPFWILGFASLSIAESLFGNPTGSTGWGVALILCGGALFLFSARQRNILWLPLLGLWVFSTLPFSLTASSWQISNNISRLFFIPYLPAQTLLLTGFFRHAFHPGEATLVSQEKWVKAIYPAGLLYLIVPGLLLGFWGWEGARMIGQWWLAVLVILLATGITFLTRRVWSLFPPGNITLQWTLIFRIGWVYRILVTIYRFLGSISNAITTAFEGEGGLLWSLLLLVLFLSILSTFGS